MPRDKSRQFTSFATLLTIRLPVMRLKSISPLRPLEVYRAHDDACDDQQRIREAILETPISDLPLRDPILVCYTSSVADAVRNMNDHHTGCVIVEKDGT